MTSRFNWNQRCSNVLTSGWFRETPNAGANLVSALLYVNSVRVFVGAGSRGVLTARTAIVRGTARGRSVADAGEELCQHALQRTHRDQHRQCEKPSGGLHVLDRREQGPRGGAARDRFHDVYRVSVPEHS